MASALVQCPRRNSAIAPDNMSVALIVRSLPLVRSIVRCAGRPRTGDSEKPALQGFPALSPGLTGESASASGFAQYLRALVGHRQPGNNGVVRRWASTDGVARYHFVKANRLAQNAKLSPRFIWMASKETDEFVNRPETMIEGAGTSLKARSEEHTSELQSLRHLVCRLLLEKKK